MVPRLRQDKPLPGISSGSSSKSSRRIRTAKVSHQVSGLAVRQFGDHSQMERDHPPPFCEEPGEVETLKHYQNKVKSHLDGLR